MAGGVNFLKGHPCANDCRPIDSRVLGWLIPALLAAGLASAPAARADEFDLLSEYSEAKPLNDSWQTCAANYVKPRLQSKRSSKELAREAMESCESRENRLRRFLTGEIGRRSAANVIAVLREKYEADLAIAVDELRTRESD